MYSHKRKFISLTCAIFCLLVTSCSDLNSAAYKKQIPETQEVLHNLTCSEKEYEYYWNKKPPNNSREYKVTDKSDEFLSWKNKTFKGINGKKVKTYYLYYPRKSTMDHVNVAYGLLLYKAIKYKLAHPKEENEIYTCEFRFSPYASVNLVKSSKWYGCMKNLYEDEMDKYGFVRLSYMLYFAAKIGIHTYVTAQLPGKSDHGVDLEPSLYFTPKLKDKCSEKHGLKSHKVSEFLHYHNCDWIAYENKAATDMMHAKFLAAKHFLSDENKVVDNSFFTASSNIDGINENGSGFSGKSQGQTGLVVTNHELMFNVYKNFHKFVINYLGEHEADNFRSAYHAKIAEQRAEIASNGYENIKDEMLIYLGTPEDQVFELYFTPFDSGLGNWSDQIPHCKYVDKLKNSKQWILLYMTNPKNSSFGLLDTFYQRVVSAYKVVRNEIEVENSEFFLRTKEPLPTCFDELKVGVHLGHKFIKEKPNHQKDLLFEYEEGGKRCGTTLFSTLNNHLGAYFYQVNTILVMKENEDVGLGNIRSIERIYKKYEYYEA